MHLLDRLKAIWHVPEAVYYLEERLMATAADYAARLDTVSNDLSSELADLKQRIADAVASGQAADQDRKSVV